MKRGSELNELIGYRLQLAYSTAIEDVRVKLEPLGITPPKLIALILIRDNPGCGQTWLGNALRVNRSSAMKIVNELVKRDLIERRAGRDLRSNALHLSKNGAVRIHAMLDVVREADTRITQRLSSADRSTLLRLLNAITADPGVAQEN